MKIFYTHLDSPIGTVFLASSDRGVCAISIAVTEDVFLSEIKKLGKTEEDKKRLHNLKKDLQDYFTGKRVDFKGYAMDISIGTEFQKRIWKKLLGIPYGETRSYKWLAEQAGRGEKDKQSILAVQAIAF